ncbi:MAG: hypothetical protein H7061_10160 [Bdellovibrionaceae bacterium]|nr:hypothetical protein [Bdellovibrio sp.]
MSLNLEKLKLKNTMEKTIKLRSLFKKENFVKIFATEQFVNRPLEQVFDFFSKAENLQKITPPLLNFKILTPLPINLGEGTLIEYQIKVHGFPMKWRTRIESWRPPYQFVDTQLKGPYKLWHHTHEFIAVNPVKTLMKDTVRYQVPFGILGLIVNRLLIKSDIQKIFSYRRSEIQKIMNTTLKPLLAAPLLQRITFTGKIHLINNDQELHSALEILNAAEALGFDTETRPSFKKGEVYKVALLQLSTETDAFVLRLHNINNFQKLIALLENRAIVKVGVAIRDDLKLLQKTFSFTPQGFVELQTLAKEKGLKNAGLKSMTEEALNVTISKGPKMTNWEAPHLTERQLLYAATDAWIGLTLYRKLTTL